MLKRFKYDHLGSKEKKMLYQDDSDLKHETLEKKGINQVILKIEH